MNGYWQWVRATWSGWALGVLLTVAAALAAEAMGVGGAQSPVGFGMGAGVGILQARTMRGFLSDARTWALASAAGIAAPFAVFDLLRAGGFQIPYSLYLCVALGGVCAGIWQARLLRRAVANAWMWVPASAVGWLLGATAAAAADAAPRALSLRGLAGAGLYLALALGGGLLLGAVTGAAKVRLRD